MKQVIEDNFHNIKSFGFISLIMVVGSFILTSNTKRRATYKFSTDMDTEAATKVSLFCYCTNSSSFFLV